MANWELVIEGRQDTNDMLTVLHYQSSGTEPPDWTALAVVLEGHLSDHVSPLCGARTTWVGYTIREDIPGGVGTFIPLPNAPLVGSVAVSDQNDVMTMLVIKNTGSLVKPTKGWAQQGGLSAAGLQPDGTWDTSVRAAVIAFYEDIRVLNIAGPTTLQMVVKARNPTAPNTQAYTPVQSIAAAGRPRTMRSRLVGQGS